MRRLPSRVCAPVLLAAAAAAPAYATGPATGGTPVPSFSGGVAYGQPVRAVPRVRRVSFRPVATEFSVAPGTLEAGAPATFAFRVDGRARRVRVRILFARADDSAPAKLLRLGYRRTRRRYSHVWKPGAGELRAGVYTVSLQAFDDAGKGLRRTAALSGREQVTVEVPPPTVLPSTGVFPVRGGYSLGGEGARFGAARQGHIHQGHDITARSGTPLVAPVAATVTWVAFQAGGAGHYVVMRGADSRDYVFMHLRRGSITAREGAVLEAGEQFAQVGRSGTSSGPHLHFEIWPDGWYSSADSRPIDPLAQLQAWAGSR
jgi:murein DD-endopeptidase MepM/ murein hydrolase activator NlpD